MKAILVRGGSSQIQQYLLTPSLKDFAIVADSIKTPVLEVYSYQTQFTQNSKNIIQNMFENHRINRCLGATSVSKYKYSAPITVSSQLNINTIRLIGLTVCGVGVTIFTTLGALYLFQRSERERNSTIQNIIIDTASQEMFESYVC